MHNSWKRLITVYMSWIGKLHEGFHVVICWVSKAHRNCYTFFAPHRGVTLWLTMPVYASYPTCRPVFWPSVRPYVSIWQLLNRFWWHLMLCYANGNCSQFVGSDSLQPSSKSLAGELLWLLLRAVHVAASSSHIICSKNIVTCSE
jgi:hypothetical protein